jgi:hypothetical protein
MQDSYEQCQNLYDRKNNMYFLTPLYVTKNRDRLENETLIKGFITYVPLKCDSSKDADFWVKRGTALICHMD